MRLDRYSAIQFDGLAPLDLASAVAEWVIPSGARRQRRSAQGVPPSLQASALLVSDDHVGFSGCTVKARVAADASEYILRLVHRDESPEVLWSTTFRLSRQSGGTLLEAAVARDAPRGWNLEAKAAAPRVVLDLIEKHEAAVRPRELVLPELIARSPEDVEAVVEQLLLAPERQVPVVVVARDLFGNEQAAVDLPTIARRMQGIAVVVSLDGSGATGAFSDILAARGRNPMLRCFNGAIHSYGPTRNIDDVHRLWMRPSLETLPKETRSEYVGETLARHLSLDRAPPNILFAIEDFDRRERQTRKPSTRAPASTKAGTPVIEALKAELAAAEQLLEEANAAAIRAEEARRDAERQLERAELDASTERTLREALQDQLTERRAAAAATAIAPELRDSLRAIVCATDLPSPKRLLDVIEALWPDRVAVLPEARHSAESEGARFRKYEEIWHLLQRLCTRYYDGLLQGGDAIARDAFTKYEYAPQGSETEMKSPACIKDRTRLYKGKPLVMWQHLRAGGKGAAEDCVRIHFAWVAAERRLVIGHCGAHLKEA